MLFIVNRRRLYALLFVLLLCLIFSKLYFYQNQARLVSKVQIERVEENQLQTDSSSQLSLSNINKKIGDPKDKFNNLSKSVKQLNLEEALQREQEIDEIIFSKNFRERMNRQNLSMTEVNEFGLLNFELGILKIRIFDLQRKKNG